jgi:hypothetical protein
MRLICWRVLLLWLKLRGEFGNMLPRMRDIETIDSELRLVAALRRAIRERGRHPRRWMWRMRHWINAASSWFARSNGGTDDRRPLVDRRTALLRRVTRRRISPGQEQLA